MGSKSGNGSEDVANSSIEGFIEKYITKDGQIARHCSWWEKDPADEPESELGRVAHGMAHRVDRLKAIGEGQVPCVVECVWRLLMKGCSFIEATEWRKGG